MRTISIKLPRELIDELDELVRLEIFLSRSEAMRTAALELLRRYMMPHPSFMLEDEELSDKDEDRHNDNTSS